MVAARVREPELVGAPVAVVERGDRGLVVRAVSIEARREGVTRGLRRREAEARCAGLAVVDADDTSDARAFDVVVRAVEQLVPLLVLDRPGRLSFPTRGPSRYFGGDDALARRVLGVVHDTGIDDVRVGIADGDLAAGLAARATDVLVVPPGDSPGFLAPWSVGVVAPSVDGGAELVDLLVRLGLRTLGAFAELPEAAVLARFGLPGVYAHRLARGEGMQGATPVPVPPELVESLELDPPAVRVDEAAFAAKALADRLLGRLDDLGLSCSRVVVEAETEHGERMTRCWRHDGALTPATLVTRVRWQLEAWLSGRALPATPDDVDDVITSGITLLRLVPDDVVPAIGRQLGFWGSDPAAADRAGRALARVQGMLDVEAVVTAVPAGGRTPSERVHWVPWGEPRDVAVDLAPRDPAAPWPGAVPGPAPARVFDPPLPAELLDADGAPVTVSGRGDASGAPAVLRCAALAGGGGPVVGVAGPWAHDLRWWDVRNHRQQRRVLWQVVVATGDGHDTGEGDGESEVACLVAVTRGRASVEAIYD
ncbi:MAG TPA: DNA polymerase Y family protein [Acidimicrobiia bacterium]|nr:DNA polymerase Y family protein [Acidimicrobiia bacterium]